MSQSLVLASFAPGLYTLIIPVGVLLVVLAIGWHLVRRAG
jgi:hypothetical protein